MSKKHQKHQKARKLLNNYRAEDYGAKKMKLSEDSQTLTVSREELEQIVASAVEQIRASSVGFVVNVNEFEYDRLQDLQERRLFLYGEIMPPEEYAEMHGAATANIVECIMKINLMDADLPKSERKPITLFINSPGGSVTDGFAIISAIETSKTPVITVNIGEWSSMAFLIGIAGHLRLSLPNMTFLLHDGTAFVVGSANKVRDRTRFDERYEKKVVRTHVLKHTKISKKEYKKRAREEFYMLADEALKYGVIDQIVEDINDIL